MTRLVSRRRFVQAVAAAAGGFTAGGNALGVPGRAQADSALIAISLDLEMSRNFPNWEDTHWDYEKGNLNAETKQYAVEAARRVKAVGGVIHFFLVGSALEQEDVSWLKEIAEMGHSIGNHSYDHVNLLAQTLDEVQPKFARAPWLVSKRSVGEVLRDNIHLTSAAMKSRLGLEASGFRTPGGYSDGLNNREDLQRMLLELGFRWVSSMYPKHPTQPSSMPTTEVFEGILRAQQAAQPFVYPSGLVEIPMSPISDAFAFRISRWKLEEFLKATRMNLEWAIENRKVFDFLGHPAILYVKDPDFKTIDLICETVKASANRARIADLKTIAQSWA